MQVTLLAFALFSAGLHISAIDRIRINAPTVYPDTVEARRTLDSAFSRAAIEASELFGDVLTVTYARAPAGRPADTPVDTPADTPAYTPAYTIDIVANNIDEGRTLILTIKRATDNTAAAPATFFGPWGEHLARDLAHTVRYLYYSLVGFETFPLAEPPVYLDELSGRMVSTVDLGYSAPITPTSVAVSSNGNILVGTSVAAVELDYLYRELGKPGRELYTSDRIAYAYDVGVTAAGTIFSRSATGGQVFVIRPGFARHQRLQTGIDTPIASLPLSDGSYLVVDATSRRAVRLEGRTAQPLDIYPSEYSYVSVVAAGPEATFWTWDALTGAILVYTAEGIRADTVVPLLPQEERAGVRAMHTLPNGDFLLLTINALYRFNRQGVPLWRLNGLPPPLSGNFMMVQSMAVDPDRGYIYLTSATAQKVYRLVDRFDRTIESDLDARILTINRRITNDPNDADAFAAKARIYEEEDAPALAAETWRTVLDINPFDSAAESALGRTEGLMIAGQARQGRERTLELLGSLGLESARPTYSIAVQMYEQSIAKLVRAPELRAEIRSELETFRREFDQHASPGSRIDPPSLRVVDFTDLFPALIQYYRANAAGTLVVTNDKVAPMHDLVASVDLRFSDYPIESDPVAVLEPGASAEIPILLVLSPDVLGLEEDIPVLARLELSYTTGGERNTTAITHVVTLRRNTALFWDDSGKLVSFVTPNDDLVTRFALDVVRAMPPPSIGLLSDRAWRAAVIADAVGAYGIRYIEDPRSPFTEVFGQTGALDTVRFPRNTLRVRTGDCDDTTALLASLYEAAGIDTAIMTSPGHVFLAFDTTEPVSNRWLYEGSGRTVIVHHGTLWLPIETTILERGFVAAWEEASRLVRTHGELVEFLPTNHQRSIYPPIPLPSASFDLVPPQRSAITTVHDGTQVRVSETMYRDALGVLDQERSSLSARESARISNRIGVLHARYGDLNAAERVLRNLVARTPNYAPAHINLSNLFRLRGDHHSALESAEQAVSLRPRSAAAHLVLVQAAADSGDSMRAREAMAALRAIDSVQAARFSHLLEADEDTRASGGEAPAVFAWEEQ